MLNPPCFLTCMPCREVEKPLSLLQRILPDHFDERCTILINIVIRSCWYKTIDHEEAEVNHIIEGLAKDSHGQSPFYVNSKLRSQRLVRLQPIKKYAATFEYFVFSNRCIRIRAKYSFSFQPIAADLMAARERVVPASCRKIAEATTT